MLLQNLFGGSYKHRFVDFNNQRCINWLPVPKLGNEHAESELALFPTPGLTSFVDTGSNTNLRALFTASTLVETRCFTVADQTLYEVNSGGTVTSRGTLSSITNNATSVFMQVNGNRELFIGHSSAAYYFDLSTNTLTQITDPDYPGFDGNCAYMDGYLFVVKNGRVYYSDLNSFSSWNSLSVLTPTFKADASKAVATYNGDLIIFGNETIEVYSNDGTTPFVRYDRSQRLIGIHAIESIAVYDRGVFFLGRSKDGEAAVYFLNANYQVEQISPFCITWQLNNTSNATTDAYGYIQQTKDGHVLYYLTIPTLDTTFVYDVSTTEWHERQSRLLDDSAYAEFRGHYYTNFNGKHLFADSLSDSILKEDYSTATENGQTIQRIVRSPTYFQEYQYISVYDFQLITSSAYIAEAGSDLEDPVIAFSYSKDGGASFISYGNLSLKDSSGKWENITTNWESWSTPWEAIPDYKIHATKLGTARRWVIDLTLTDPITIALIGAKTNGVINSY